MTDRPPYEPQRVWRLKRELDALTAQRAIHHAEVAELDQAIVKKSQEIKEEEEYQASK